MDEEKGLSERMRTVVVLSTILVLVLVMVAFDFTIAHFMGKSGTPFAMAGNLLYAFFVLKPTLLWLRDRI